MAPTIPSGCRSWGIFRCRSRWCRSALRPHAGPSRPPPWPPAVRGRPSCGARGRDILSSRMAGTTCSMPRSSAFPTPKRWRRGLREFRAWWNTGFSLAWSRWRSSPGREGCGWSRPTGFRPATSGSMHMYRSSRSRIVFIGAMICGCLGPIAADAQQPSAAAVALARDVVVAKGASGMTEPLVRGVIETVKNSFVPTNPNLTRELNDVATVLHKELDGKSSEALEQIARAYATRFTEQELKDLLVFYKTPLGQKFLKEEPNAIEDALKRAQQWADTFADTVMARMRSEMQKKGHQL